MLYRRSLSAALLLVLLSIVPQAVPGAQNRNGSETERQSASFTVQVGVFSNGELAERMAGQLNRSGEKVTWTAPDSGSRVRLTRVFSGVFTSSGQALRYGRELEARGLIRSFVVRPGPVAPPVNPQPPAAAVSITDEAVNLAGPLPSVAVPDPPLPVLRRMLPDSIPGVDISKVPRPDPVMAALADITGFHDGPRGGLWVSGDVADAFARLQWIIGAEYARFLSIDESGQVHLNSRLLERAAGIDDSNRSEARAVLMVSEYVRSNEGLLLMMQLTEGPGRYCLHVGRYAPTAGGVIQVDGSLNLDNNYDSRINPYRRSGKKLDRERPPAGFDAEVAINPAARWFNLRTREMVPAGSITFHELAEAHAKVALKLEYLQNAFWPGAHNVAIEREVRMKDQRPTSDYVVTAGSNRVFKSEEEIRKFKADLNARQ